MEKGALIGVIVVILIVVGFFLFQSGDDATEIKEGSSQSSGSENSVKIANEIEMTSSGFSPATLNIKQGDKVTFVNKDSSAHWPASAMHPTHTVYPGSDIKKCGTNEERNIFDACNDIPPGESWSFTFNEKGNWGYHDHLSASLFGKIIVS